jgi:hypothetical protein
LTDAVITEQAILGAVDNNFSNPLYLRASPFLDVEQRRSYATATTQYERAYLTANLGSVIATHVKQAVESTLTFPIRAWAYGKTTASIRSGFSDLTFPNVLRLVWAGVLVIEYALAVAGVVALWRRQQRWDAVSLGLVPFLVFAGGLILQAQDRFFLSSELILIVPACLALQQCSRSPGLGANRGGQMARTTPIAWRVDRSMEQLSLLRERTSMTSLGIERP